MQYIIEFLFISIYSEYFQVKHVLERQDRSRLIGPNCPGIIKVCFLSHYFTVRISEICILGGKKIFNFARHTIDSRYNEPHRDIKQKFVRYRKDLKVGYIESSYRKNL